MSEIWFVSAPLPGHIDWGGMLKTACVLRDRGYDVVWVSQPPIRHLIEAAGITFAPIDETGWLWPPPPPPDVSKMNPVEAMFLRYRRALDTWLSADLIPPAVRALIALAEGRGTPSLIVSDPFLSAAALAAEVLDVPFAVTGWIAGPPLDEDRLYAVQADLGKISRERIGALLDEFGLKGVNFSEGATPSVQSPHLHISYFNAEWYQADTFLPQTQFVGGVPTPPITPAPAWLEAIPPNAPLALITLGSTFTGDLGFYAWAAQAAARLRLLPIVVIGGNTIEPDEKSKLVAALPPGTRLLNWIDYDHVFPRLKVIVHHGGMGTTHRAAIQGIPQVVVPHAADQRGQARRVAQAKVGLNLTAHDVRNGQLLPAIRALTTDEKVLANCRRIAADFAALGGAERAADLLLKVPSRLKAGTE
jgi:MGT family glycosyltransferase